MSAASGEREQMWFKPESLQPIGSFKLRGAYNKIASFSDEERRRGVISYSSGNHAQGVAYAARAMGVKAVIVMPRNAPENQAGEPPPRWVRRSSPLDQRAASACRKRKSLRSSMVIPSCLLTTTSTSSPARVPSGLEILQDCPDVELVLVPVGGGGLISGDRDRNQVQRLVGEGCRG